MYSKAWFPYGRKHVVTVVEIDSFSISMTFTTLLRHIHDHMETRLNKTYAKFGKDYLFSKSTVFVGCLVSDMVIYIGYSVMQNLYFQSQN